MADIFEIKDSVLIRYNGEDSDVAVPEGVKVIGVSAFIGRERVRNVKLPDGVERIERNAFLKCGIERIDLPDSVKEISDGAFMDCGNLKEITIPAGAAIGGEAFVRTPWLNDKRREDPLVIINGTLIDGRACRGKVVIPENVTAISNSAFADNTRITDVSFPDGPVEIGEWAFSGCKGLTHISITNSETSVGTCAFEGCTSLEASLPDGMTAVAKDAFITFS